MIHIDNFDYGGALSWLDARENILIALTVAERNRIKETLRSRKDSNTIKQRCRILLALDCNQNSNTTYDDCAYYLGVSVGMIHNVVKLYSECGLERTLVINRNIDSNNSNRKIDGAMEARIIAMACGNPPEGYARWTVKLITEQARIVS